MTLKRSEFKGWKSKRWTVCAIALVSFAAGSLITARLVKIIQVKADSNRVFELRVYHTVPGTVACPPFARLPPHQLAIRKWRKALTDPPGLVEVAVSC